MAGEHIDLSVGSETSSSAQGGQSRKFIGVHFQCCDVYSRIYINSSKTAYQGNCPRCAKQVRVRIEPGGTSSRFFRVT
jgi:hypothetical protein